ncbi:unnamed protein product [Lactuca virosa]|uniref:Uncharacterized protein n=1 Tax=Lactuca virosa TaxID=75947 RepID=A0AAU9MSR0_9ASTR|nr:unnamed protein product [Lactuca virosa]
MEISNIAHKLPNKHKRRIYRGLSKNTDKTLQTINMMRGYGRKPNLGENERRRVISTTSEHQIYVLWFLGHHLPNPPNQIVHSKRLRAQVSTMEQQQQQMKEQMEMVLRMMNMSGNQPRAPPDNPPEDN